MGRDRDAGADLEVEYFDAPAPEEGAVFDAGPGNDAPANDTSSPFERALSEAMMTAEGRYTEDDRDLVTAALSQGEMPSHVGARELPGLAREWLEGALALRGADDAPALALLDRMTREGSRTAARMAKRTLERLAALALAGKAAARLGKK